ncbi:hypothetical protein CY652_22375 [Burkholderia sp. WAC0059]|uniref:hypothetical protein n=1 Tax=Burkholderia sp. WAC0059 TaxID=2066022 RepID=UPI000C7F2201|nr:hypothetical protein [Burkholderia sp. WAC0059]PLZ00193.1 hypothetical protein CY652_22375 [Burkholderia sp. WAC0059]
MQRYAEWCRWLDDEPARQQKRKEAQQAKEEADKSESESSQATIQQLRLDRWLWAVAGTALGAALTALLMIVH